MTIMRGLPASGKSMIAEEIAKSAGNTVRINKDLLRTMLHFDKFTGKNESHTRDAARKLADWFLTNNVNVIIDDTNLNPGVMQSWKDLAKIHNAKVEVVDVDTPIGICVMRDNNREKKVGGTVIKNMALRYGLLKIESPIVICDIDGTIADTTHRQHFVEVAPGERKDWHGFFEAMDTDPVREDVRKMLIDHYNNGATVVFMSGRPDNYKDRTLEWLEKNALSFAFTLMMRKASDSRDDTIVKKEMLDMYFPDKSKIISVIDDRPSVIRMWRENGLEVVDVGKGIEF